VIALLMVRLWDPITPSAR